MTDTTCVDCRRAPATTDAYTGRRRVGDEWVPMTRRVCDPCAAEDARERRRASR